MEKGKFLGVLALALTISLIQIDVSAQELRKGNVLINAGLGFGYFNNALSRHTGLPVGFIANVEYSITSEIAVGGYVAFTRGSYNYYFNQYDDKYYYNSLDVGVRGSYHFGKLLRVNNEKFDPYAGALLGLANRSSDYLGDTWVRPGVFAGARYYFSNNFGVYGEAGYGIHPITVGLTFKLR